MLCELCVQTSQPTTLQPGLVRTTASSDKTPPVSRVDTASPHALASGMFEATGIASDTGDVVAGVEVSVDDGRTWHPADGTIRWRYRLESGSVAGVVRSRAVDDSGNLEAAGGPPQR